jgi:hypothetical protein
MRKRKAIEAEARKIMAWVDSDGVIHTNWIYEPRRIVGPILSSSVDRASIGELRTTARALSEMMMNLDEVLGAELERDLEPTNDPLYGRELPDDFLIETSEASADLSLQITSLAAQTSAKWRLETLHAIDWVILDRIDELSEQEETEE